MEPLVVSAEAVRLPDNVSIESASLILDGKAIILRDESVPNRYWECERNIKLQQHNQLILTASDFPDTRFVVTLRPGLYFVERLRNAILHSVRDDSAIPVLADFGLSRWMIVAVVLPIVLLPVLPILVPLVLAGINGKFARSSSLSPMARAICVCVIDLVIVVPIVALHIWNWIQ